MVNVSKAANAIVSTLVTGMLAGVVVACTWPAVTVRGQVHASDVPARFGYVARTQGMPTVVLGNPFGVPQAELERRVVDAMQGQQPAANARFVAATSEAAGDRMRIVMMLDAPVTLPASALCGETARLRPKADGQLRLMAALCLKESPLAEATAVAPRARSVDDPVLSQVVAAATRELVPNVDPFLDLE